MKYIIGNWKANMNSVSAVTWADTFTAKLNGSDGVQSALNEDRLRIIVCPPYPLIALLAAKLPKFKNIYVGAEDVSAYPPGSYTGEVTAETLSGLARYVIIGHSERRKLFNETEEQIAKKIEQTAKSAMEPILCVRGLTDTIHELAQNITYEPVDAIGTGNNASPDLVIQVKTALKIDTSRRFLYGGSVTADNCKAYLDSPEIDGLLVGKASLDAEAFYAIASRV